MIRRIRKRVNDNGCRDKTKLDGELDGYEIKIKKILFIYYFNSIVIPPTRRNVTEALIHRISNHHDLLPEIPRYCCLLVI